MLRVQTPLSDEVEELIRNTIGCCLAVHRALGPGLRELMYSRALCIELDANAIPHQRECRFPVRYRGHLLAEQRVDLVVKGQIVVEVKAVEQFAPVHHRQIVNYMRVAGVSAGLLVNFNVSCLKDGISRKVLTPGSS